MSAYKFTRDVEARMQATKFPIPFFYGPERTERGAYCNAIVVERDPDTPDGLLPSPGASSPGQSRRYVRMCAIRISVWAKSERAAARVEEHQDLCEQIVDALTCSIEEIARSTKLGAPALTEMRYAAPESLGVPEAWAGVVYLVRMTLPRGVARVSYLGDGLPSGVVGGTNGVVRIARNASSDVETVEPL